MFGIEGKIALITGASGGLGAHFAKVLAEQGAHVILAARRTDKLQEQINLIKADGGQARSIELDVTSNESVTAAFADIYATEKRLDILVNNAGVGDDPKKFLNTEEEDWSWQMQTNLDGAWRVARDRPAVPPSPAPRSARRPPRTRATRAWRVSA